MARANSLISDEVLHAGIEHYTGHKVRGLERYDDPRVAGCIALRCTVLEGEPDGGTVLQFFISGNAPVLKTKEDVSVNLEEAEFETWPPRSGKLKFF